MDSESLSKFFRARKTMNQMLKDRSYIVFPDDIETESRESFDSKYRDQISSLTITGKKEGEMIGADGSVIVFFSSDPKIDNEKFQKYFKNCNDANVENMILVVSGSITS